MYEQKYGKNYIPEDMTVQDWGVTYKELEPYYDRFEKTAGLSGQAGKLNGQVVPGGNPFEGNRTSPYPLPPLKTSHAGEVFRDAATKLGYHPFPNPAANASQPYTNPDGSKFGQCQYCGYCERYGCESNAKASPTSR